MYLITFFYPSGNIYCWYILLVTCNQSDVLAGHCVLQIGDYGQREGAASEPKHNIFKFVLFNWQFDTKNTDTHDKKTAKHQFQE